VLSVLDRGWREHLQAIEELQATSFIRAPGTSGLAGYRRDAVAAFNQMRQAADREIVGTLFHVQVSVTGQAQPG
jgi:preprotein translocase subunit SecA